MRQRGATGEERTKEARGHGSAPDRSESPPPLEELEPERAGRKLEGLPGRSLRQPASLCLCTRFTGCFNPVPALQYRSSFLAVAMAMTFVVYGAWARRSPRKDEHDSPAFLDWVAASVALVAFLYPVITFEEFIRHAVRPTGTDLALGILVLLLVLEAARRTVGWILPAVCVGFVAYAFWGDLIPAGYLLGTGATTSNG